MLVGVFSFDFTLDRDMLIKFANLGSSVGFIKHTEEAIEYMYRDDIIEEGTDLSLLDISTKIDISKNIQNSNPKDLPLVEDSNFNAFRESGGVGLSESFLLGQREDFWDTKLGTEFGLVDSALEYITDWEFRFLEFGCDIRTVIYASMQGIDASIKKVLEVTEEYPEFKDVLVDIVSAYNTGKLELV